MTTATTRDPLELISGGHIPGFDPFRLEDGYRFDVERASRVLEFFESCLTHVKGALARKPFVLELWQAAVLSNLFGWVDDAGLRRFREAFIYIPRKNGKTTFAAGIGLYLLLCDGELGAEVVAAAASRDQASHIFAQAKGMVIQEPELEGRCTVYRAFRSIEVPETNSVFRTLAADADNNHGQNTHGAIIDELHAHPTPDLAEVLETGTGSREQPLIVHITTADFLRPSICNRKYERACKVRDGVIGDASFLPAIWEATLEDDWQKPETWRKANPCLGVAVREDYIARKFQQALDDPAFENVFRRLHLNQRTQQDVRWIRMESWAKGADPFTLEDLEGEPCYGGLDLSSTDDLSAFALVFPRQDGTFRIVVTFWCPSSVPEEKERRDRVPYLTWQKQGWIEPCGEAVVDYEKVKAAILAARDRYDLREIAYDPWNSQGTANDLEGEGIACFKFAQNFANYAEPCKEFQRLLALGKIHHGGNPVLTWNAGNVAADIDHYGNARPSKKKSTNKIDGIVAALMAFARALLAPPPQKAVYKTRGLV